MSFAHPEVFLMIALVPLMLVTAILASRSRGRQWKRLVAARLRPLLVTASSPAPRWISFGVALAAFILVIVALAGPNAGYRQEAETIRGRNLLLAIDISRSMLAEDESPNRLAAALASAIEVIEHFPNDRIGLIAFSGAPFLQAPLTVDHAAIRETLQQLDPVTLRELDAEFLPRGGSDIPQAVRLAADTLKETGQRNNALIIFTDGEMHEGGLEDAADLAADAGLTIFTAGFGSEDGAFIPSPRHPDNRFRDRNGDPVFTQLKTESLRLLARRTGGFYTRGSGPYFALNLETAVERLDRFEMEGQKRQVAIPRFQWFLLPAIILFIASILINTPWRLMARSATAALAFLCLAPDADARLMPATEAEQAYRDGDFGLALELFTQETNAARGERRARLELGAAAAAYRLQDFTRATRSYSAALLSSDPGIQVQAHYSLANSLFYRGLQPLQDASEQAQTSTLKAVIALWTDALGHYEGALAVSPEHEEARNNHEIVRERLENLKQLLRKQEEQEQEDRPNEDRQQDDQNPEDPNDPEDQNDDGNNGQDEQNDNGNKDPNDDNEDPQNADPEDPNQDENQPPENPTGGNPDPAQQNPNQGAEPRPTDQRPDETPEEYAHRILAENADFQTTPLMRMRVPYQRPKKDW